MSDTAPFAISKLKLAENLIARGLSAQFRAFVNGDDALHLLFYTSQEIQSNHPAFGPAFTQFCNAQNLDEATAVEILEASRAGEPEPVVEEPPPEGA